MGDNNVGNVENQQQPAPTPTASAAVNPWPRDPLFTLQLPQTDIQNVLTKTTIHSVSKPIVEAMRDAIRGILFEYGPFL